MPRPFMLMLLFLCSAMAARAADSFTFSNPPGPHAVGVKVVQQYDRSRLYKTAIDLYTGEPAQGERARPIQVLVWYPAAQGGKRLSFRDYLDTSMGEDDFTRSAAERRRFTDRLIEEGGGARRVALLRDLARPMLAVRDARAKQGRFPVVVYAPGFSASATENADLCEYLASHGYVVLASPSLGEHRRETTLTAEGLEPQARDISWLIGFADTLAHADTGRLAVAGFSWGGLANVVAAARDPRIKALVSLEGSVRYFPELVDGGKDAVRNVAPARVAVPLLYVGARPEPDEAPGKEPAPSFIDGMRYADVVLVTLEPMRHVDFSSLNQRFAADSDFVSHTRDEVATAYGWAARYTLRFLDAQLKGDAAGRAFIDNTPAANGAAGNLVTVDIRRKTQDPPPGWESFVSRLRAQGFEHAIPVYTQLQAQGASFKVERNDFIGWATALKQRGRFAEAREIFRLGDHLYPSLWAKLDLAEMQVKTGEVQAAVHTYRKILVLEPDNATAQRYLRQHGAAPASPAP